MSTLAPLAKPPERTAGEQLRLRQFTVDEYHKMIESGVFGSKNRVELLEGWIVNKMSHNLPHASSLTRVANRLGKICPGGWTMRVQLPITLTDSEPEPDIVLARGPEDTYDTRHPEPSDIGVLIEVGDSSAMSDRRYKGELYAKARIAEFWLLNLVERKLEVHTRPRAGKYRTKVEYGENEYAPLVLDGEKIANILVSELLPKS